MATPPAPAQAGDDVPGDPPALTVAAVARRLGVAPATLRTWDRRYGLGPSEHRAGSHRRYAPTDVARLEVMHALTVQGVTPAEAARVALENPAAGLASVTALPTDAAGRREHGAPRPGGGQVVALPHGTAAARGLARAAMALDGHAATEIVRTSVDRRGVVPTWDQLLVPVLTGIGQRWQRTGQGVDVEHLLSECVLAALRPTQARGPQPTNLRPVLLACAEEEQHSLPVHVLAAALAERRVASRVLGMRVPRDALAAAVLRAGPSVVFVWSQLRSTGHPDQLDDLPGMRPAPRVLVGGPGWAEPLPAGITRVEHLDEAVQTIATAVGTAIGR